jgi:hypothetical protein
MKVLSLPIAVTFIVCTACPVNADDNWVCSLDRKSQTAQKLFAVSQVAKAQWLKVSQDGQMFAFSGTNTANERGSRIWTCKADGSNMRDLGRGTMPSWSPRGRRIVFSREAPESGVWIMRADGGEQQILDNHGWGASWSPDGTKIAWHRTVAGAAEIVIHRIAEDDFDVVFGDRSSGVSQVLRQISWFRNSQGVTFVAQEKNRESICSVRLTDHTPPIVWRYQPQPGTGVWGAEWLDDQTMMILQHINARERQLFTVTVKADSATAVEPIRLSEEFGRRSNESVSASSDGAKLFFLSRD